MSHTKGPWRAEKFCVWSDEKYVAATQTGINSDEQQANAKLIAAAPELLEALKALISEHQDNPEHWFPARLIPIINKAEAAIAKAEETP